MGVEKGISVGFDLSGNLWKVLRAQWISALYKRLLFFI